MRKWKAEIWLEDTPPAGIDEHLPQSDIVIAIEKAKEAIEEQWDDGLIVTNYDVYIDKGTPMRDKTIDLNAHAGGGVRAICDAIEGLKAWKREYKERTEMDLDISGDLKAIRSNLNDLMRMTEGADQ